MTTLDQIRLIDRKVEVPHDGPMCDLLWYVRPPQTSLFLDIIAFIVYKNYGPMCDQLRYVRPRLLSIFSDVLRLLS